MSPLMTVNRVLISSSVAGSSPVNMNFGGASVTKASAVLTFIFYINIYRISVEIYIKHSQHIYSKLF